MLATSSLIALSFLTGTQARSLPSLNNLQVHQQNGITWTACPKEINQLDPNNRTFECGTLSVPLDYSDNSSDKKLDLDIIRIPAVKQPKKGSIFFNWGGPGGDGLNSMAVSASVVQPMTGGYHDLISWDPRGTGKTLSFSCYENATERALADVALQRPLANSTADGSALGRAFAEAKLFADQCKQRLNATGDYVGTAFTVRDMFQILDNLDEGGKLQYWGFSYGTVLGATAISMFPDRIHRAILDAVQNPHEYYHTFGDPEMYTDTDETWNEFLKACMGNPDACALAKHASSTAELGEKIDRMFEDLKIHPFPADRSIINYNLVKSYLLNDLYYPNFYPRLATALEAVLMRNITAIVTLFAPSGPSESPTLAEILPGIRCGDKFLRTDDLDPIETELKEKIYKTSPKFGDYPSVPMTTCARWGFQAKERYDGDFHVKTSYPVLLIGNTWDPITPLKSAYNVSAGLEGSVVLQHNGHGHMTIVQPSSCTSKYIADYFVNGSLPHLGMLCEPDVPLFGKPAS